jgi:hypothetical protein
MAVLVLVKTLLLTLKVVRRVFRFFLSLVALGRFQTRMRRIGEAHSARMSRALGLGAAASPVTIRATIR